LAAMPKRIGPQTLDAVRDPETGVWHTPRESWWTSRMSYPIGLAMAVALSSAIYQYLKTGKPPQDAQDLQYPQTGGVDQKTGQPARALLPSQLNSFRNLYANPAQEFGNKVNDLWKTLWELSQNADWRGDPIVNKNDPVVQQIMQWSQFAAQQMGEPIYVSQQRQEGSRLTEPERFFGARDAPRMAVDPKGTSEAIRYKRAEAWVTKKWHDDHPGKPLPYSIKRKLIQAEMSKYRGVQ